MVVAPVCGSAQSVIQTILGASPNGVSAGSATLNTPSAVLAGRNGNVYAATSAGHQVVRIDSGGTIWLVAGNGNQGSSGDGGAATAAALYEPTSLALDQSGNLYICDALAYRVRRVDAASGVITTVAGNGKADNTGDGGLATAATLNTPTGIAFDIHGNLLIADSDNHVIRSVSPSTGIITTIAGKYKSGSTGNGGQATAAYLNTPTGLAVDSAGNIYVADSYNDWIRKIAPDGTITRYAGVDTSNVSPFGGGDTTLAVNNTLNVPTSIALDSAGNLYLVESSAPRVKRITPQGKIASYAGTGTSGGSGDQGLARFANLNVQGIAVDANNNLLIADGANNRIRKVTVADGIIDTIAGNGLAGFNPIGMVVRNNILYFSDTAANRIRQFDLTAQKLSVFAGTGAASFSGDTVDSKGYLYDSTETAAERAAAPLAATFNGPRGLAFDSVGSLYIADSANNRIRKIYVDGTVATVVGDGNAVTAGDLGPATASSLYQPVSIAFDTTGNLYIAERSGNVIRKVATTGTITTVAGTGKSGKPTSETGLATSQPLNTPQGVAWDPAGSLLIADSANSRIRRLTSDGMIATVAGSNVSGATGDGGQATAATLQFPYGVTADGNGNIFIADTSNNKIREIGADGIITTVAGTGVAGYTGDGSPATAFELNAPDFVMPGANCSVLIADTGNQRIRRLYPAVDYTINTSPAGLQVSVDGAVLGASPAVASLLPNTAHTIGAPSPQAGAAGTQYILPASQQVTPACASPRASVTLNFQTQYALTVTATAGGTVTTASPWQNSGASVTLTATPQTGYIFTGWTGACTGSGTCTVVMNGPKQVQATFATAPTGTETPASVILRRPTPRSPESPLGIRLR